MPCYDADAAVDHLCARDRRLARLIQRTGAPDIAHRSFQTPFQALFSAIISQQLSGRAARSIHRRSRALLPRGRITAPAVMRTDAAALRAAGLSRAKVAAVHDLAARYAAGELPDARRLKRLSDEDIIAALVAVRGVGRWTVEMLLIFYLGRPDVLPVGDLGVRKGFRLTYARPTLPSDAELSAWAERWRPYRSVASWYLWRAADSDGVQA